MYTQSIADGESIVDAEAIQEEKPEVFDRTLERLTPPLQLPRQRVHTSESPVAAQLPTRLVEETREIDHDSSVQRDLSPTHLETAVMLDNYLTEPVTTANLVSVRPCSILPDRLAIWLVRRRTMALSSLAAAVLTQEGLIRFKDLELSVNKMSAMESVTLTIYTASLKSPAQDATQPTQFLACFLALMILLEKLCLVW